jgi:exodeoxyribonuclease VII large subunit
LDQPAKSLSNYLAAYVALIRANTQTAWVVAEIAEITDRNNSHIYLDLIEQDEAGQIIAKAKAAIWKGTRTKILDEFSKGTGGSKLLKGMEVMVLVRGGMHIQHGFSLVIEGINHQFTLGEAERKLREIRTRLTEDGIIGKNRALVAPTDFTRVVVISPPAAAGLGDFQSHADLLQRAGLCQFEYLSASFQGEGAAGAIVDRISYAISSHARIDCIVIIRGGGAQADLMWLNEYVLARAICASPIPVMAGVGHERDKTILDEVSCISFHTPSKLIGHIFNLVTGNAMAASKSWDQIGVQATNLHKRIQSDIQSVLQHISHLSNASIVRSEIESDRRMEIILLKSNSDVDQATQNIELSIAKIKASTSKHLTTAEHQTSLSNRDVVLTSQKQVDILNQAIGRKKEQIADRAGSITREIQTQASNSRKIMFEHAKRIIEQAQSDARTSVQYVLGMGPKRTMQRGFVMAKRTNGKLVMRSEGLVAGDVLALSFSDGEVTADIKEVRKETP